MSEYVENPKTKGSGILCCIPQTTPCPMECKDCFFSSGRSYLEPLNEHLPNLPDIQQVGHRVVRVNDGNDSNVQRDVVIEWTEGYPLRFYNTAVPEALDWFVEPIVLTINPGHMTEGSWYRYSLPDNVMFVRIRTSVWNRRVVDEAVDYYATRGVKSVLTFMRYYELDLPPGDKDKFVYRKHLMNSYWMLTTRARAEILSRYQELIDAGIVSACSEGLCKDCGVCLREFFATKERLS